MKGYFRDDGIWLDRQRLVDAISRYGVVEFNAARRKNQDWIPYLRGAYLRGAYLSGADLDFSGGLPLSCGSFGVITDAQIEAQHAYHTLRRRPDYEAMSDAESAMVRVSRVALVDLANLWAGISRHGLPQIRAEAVRR